MDSSSDSLVEVHRTALLDRGQLLDQCVLVIREVQRGTTNATDRVRWSARVIEAVNALDADTVIGGASIAMPPFAAYRKPRI